jgi:hypothetical protein
MCQVGTFFPLAPEARLTVEGSSLVVRFDQGEEDRTIILDPLLKAQLADIVAERPGGVISWADLRTMLQARGADVDAAAARGRPASSAPER